MYKLAVKKEFIAQHFLIGGDWGPENELHSHPYIVEAILEGEHLDQHGYLLDIVDLENQLDSLVDRYRDVTLNDLPEFDGLNPSIEHFTRIFAHRLADVFEADNLSRMTIKIWENEIAWASFEISLGSEQ